MGKKLDEEKYFNANKEISKYRLDHSTFDLVDVTKFYNNKFSTVMGYMWIWIMIILSWTLLGSDIYTCLNILVFHKWSTQDYQPYAYSIAKWIFTGCIIFEFVLLFYHLLWAIHTYRTRNIALAYVNQIANILYRIKSYNFHCLFSKIEQDNFFDWACFLTYYELDNFLQILVADTPRQVINILTLRYYATDGDESNDIIANIKDIATTNLRLSIILSFMCLSVAIYAVFFFKFLLGMSFYLPIVYKLRKKGFKSLKRYCCKIVNDKVRLLVLKNHKPKDELLETGVLDLKEIKANPLLNDDLTTLDDDFEYRKFNSVSTQNTLNPDTNYKSNSSYRTNDFQYNDNEKLYGYAQSFSLQDLRNPFDSTSSLPKNDGTNSRSGYGMIAPPSKVFNSNLRQGSVGSKPSLNEKPSMSSIQTYKSYQPTNPFNDTQSHLPFINSQRGSESSVNEIKDGNNYQMPQRTKFVDPFSDPNSDIGSGLGSLNHSNDSVNHPLTNNHPYSNHSSSHPNSNESVNHPYSNPSLNQSYNELTNPLYSNERAMSKLSLTYNDDDNENIDAIRPLVLPKSNTSHSLSSAPYPIRGISLYDKKNFMRVNTEPINSKSSIPPSNDTASYPVDEPHDNQSIIYPVEKSHPDTTTIYPVASLNNHKNHASPPSRGDNNITSQPVYPIYSDSSDSDSNEENHRGYPLSEISN